MAEEALERLLRLRLGVGRCGGGTRRRMRRRIGRAEAGVLRPRERRVVAPRALTLRDRGGLVGAVPRDVGEIGLAGGRLGAEVLLLGGDVHAAVLRDRGEAVLGVRRAALQLLEPVA